MFKLVKRFANRGTGFAILTFCLLAIVSIVPTHAQISPAYIWDGEAAGDRFGLSVDIAGDVNNDGYDDIIVGAYASDSGGTDAGRAYVFSGKDSSLIYTFTGEAAEDRFGFSV